MIPMRELGGKYAHTEMEKNIFNLPVYWDIQSKNQAMLGNTFEKNRTLLRPLDFC
jgi:hypothetical protein